MSSDGGQDNSDGADRQDTHIDPDRTVTQRDTSSGLPGVSGPGVGGGGPDEELPQFEGFDITGKLGRGGMGTVWRAIQLSTKREVALKLLGSNIVKNDRLRFEREVALCARLEHRGIARVYDSGLCQGAYYYAMELIDGVHMDRYVRDVSLDRRGILVLIQTAARAIQHAHQRGVIHRDLKPSNILVSEDGRPHVVDFGLAKTFLPDDQCIEVSMDGAVAGTPAFMSPEQAAGRSNDIDTRTDTYALGVILFYLLTGEFPRDMSGQQYEVLARIAEEDVFRPRSVCGDIDTELEAILLKALALDAEDRYASVGDFATDIENYLTGEPLIARPPTTAYFLKKRMVKHRRPLIAAGMVLLAAIFAVVFYIQSIRTEQARTEHARVRAVQEKDIATAREAEADSQRNLAIRTFKSFVYEVQPVLARESAPLKLRRELVDLIIGKLPGIIESVGALDVETDRLVAATTLISGHIFKYAGDSRSARDKYSEALITFEALARLSPDAFQPVRDLAIAHVAMGELQQLTGHAEQAVKHFKHAMKIVDELEVKFPSKSELLRGDRWVLQIAMGAAALASGDPDAALGRFKRAMELIAPVKGSAPVSPRGSMQLSRTCRRLGDAQFALENSSAAREYYNKALALEAARAKAAPRTRGPQHGISECRRQLAAIALSAGAPALAQKHCELARKSAEWLALHDPDRISGWGDLAKVLYTSGQVEAALQKHAAAAAFYRQCVNILQQLDEKKKLRGRPAYLNLFDKAREALKLTEATTSRPAQ